jgi:predicted RNA-binding Zn ribbon-like protein
MTSEQRRPWRRVAGDLALNFVNTLGGREIRAPPDEGSRILEESLLDYGDLLEWAQFVELFDQAQLGELAKLAAAKPTRARATIRRAHALREAIHGIARALMARINPAAADLKVLNGELRIAAERREIVRQGGALSRSWLNPEARLDSILWPVCCAAAQLFIDGPRERLKFCPGRACGWLFLDATKNGGRRWCSMADCGNLDKVRSYRRREAKN